MELIETPPQCNTTSATLGIWKKKQCQEVEV